MGGAAAIGPVQASTPAGRAAAAIEWGPPSRRSGSIHAGSPPVRGPGAGDGPATGARRGPNHGLLADGRPALRLTTRGRAPMLNRGRRGRSHRGAWRPQQKPNSLGRRNHLPITSDVNHGRGARGSGPAAGIPRVLARAPSRQVLAGPVAHPFRHPARRSVRSLPARTRDHPPNGGAAAIGPVLASIPSAGWPSARARPAEPALRLRPRILHGGRCPGPAAGWSAGARRGPNHVLLADGRPALRLTTRGRAPMLNRGWRGRSHRGAWRPQQKTNSLCRPLPPCYSCI